MALGTLLPLFAFGAEGDEMLANYLELKTVEIEDSFLGEIGNREDWNERKDEYRKCLGYMLGLSPDRPRSDLKATISGKLENGLGSSFTSRRRSMMISLCRWRRPCVSGPRQSAYAKA